LVEGVPFKTKSRPSLSKKGFKSKHEVLPIIMINSHKKKWDLERDRRKQRLRGKKGGYILENLLPLL